MAGDGPGREGEDYPRPEEYVSVACLTNDHVSCGGAVRCACPCHRNGDVDPARRGARRGA